MKGNRLMLNNESQIDLYADLDQAPPDYYEVKPLSAAEAQRRAELEAVITKNMGGFLAVAYALREIREKELFRTTHKLFGLYIKDMWEMARSTAYQYIDAANVVDTVRQIDLSTIVDTDEMSRIGDKTNLSAIADKNEMSANGGQISWIPQNEGQARALAKYKDNPEAIKAIVTEAIRTTEDGRITASHLKRTARRLHMEKVRQAVAEVRRRNNQAPKIDDAFRKAFNAFLDQINIQRADDYKHTDVSEVIRHVQIILDALRCEL